MATPEISNAAEKVRTDRSVQPFIIYSFLVAANTEWKTYATKVVKYLA